VIRLVGQHTSNTKLKFDGLSTDTKPILEENNAGSEFYTTDTKEDFLWTGSEWVTGKSSNYYTNLINKWKVEKITIRDYFTGNEANRVVLTPPTGKRIRLQVILILAGGNSGSIFVYRSTQPTIPILPLDVSSGTRANTSGELNMLGEIGESVTVTTTGRSSNWNFIGLGYTLE
jgi:hypothetical protein